MKHEDFFEQLSNLYHKYMPETVYLVKNHPRYEEATRTLWGLIAYFSQEDDTAEISFSKDELLGTALALDVTTICFSTTNIAELCELLKQADSLDVTPLDDDRVRLTIGFNDVYKPYDPNEQ